MHPNNLKMTVISHSLMLTRAAASRQNKWITSKRMHTCTRVAQRRLISCKRNNTRVGVNVLFTKCHVAHGAYDETREGWQVALAEWMH